MTHTIKKIFRALRDSTSWASDVSKLTGETWSGSFQKLFKIQYGMNIDVIHAVSYGMHLADPLELQNYISWRQLEVFRKRNYPAKDLSLLNDKSSSSQYFKQNGINTPDTLFTYKSKNKNNEKNVESTEDFITLLSQKKEEYKYILKPISGDGGKGVFIYESNNNIKTALGDKISFAKMIERIEKANNKFGNSGYISQKLLSTHSDVKKITGSNSLSTVRLVTLNDGTDIRLLFGLMKLISGEQYVDNFGYGETHNLLSPIDIDTGRIDGLVGVFEHKKSRAPSWETTHPKTGFSIQNTEVPLWNEIKAQALQAAALFPDVPTIGWDIAATETGAVLLDANAFWGVGIVQLTQQRGIKSDLEAISPGSFL